MTPGSGSPPRMDAQRPPARKVSHRNVRSLVVRLAKESIDLAYRCALPLSTRSIRRAAMPLASLESWRSRIICRFGRSDLSISSTIVSERASYEVPGCGVSATATRRERLLTRRPRHVRASGTAAVGTSPTYGDGHGSQGRRIPARRRPGVDAQAVHRPPTHGQADRRNDTCDPELLARLWRFSVRPFRVPWVS